MTVSLRPVVVSVQFFVPLLLREGFLLFPSAVGAILVRLFLSYYVWPTHAPSWAAAARPKSSEFYLPNKHTSNMYWTARTPDRSCY